MNSRWEMVAWLLLNPAILQIYRRLSWRREAHWHLQPNQWWVQGFDSFDSWALVHSLSSMSCHTIIMTQCSCSKAPLFSFQKTSLESAAQTRPKLKHSLLNLFSVCKQHVNFTSFDHEILRLFVILSTEGQLLSYWKTTGMNCQIWKWSAHLSYFQPKKSKTAKLFGSTLLQEMQVQISNLILLTLQIWI